MLPLGEGNVLAHFLSMTGKKKQAVQEVLDIVIEQKAALDEDEILTGCLTSQYIHNQIDEVKVTLEAMLFEIGYVESQYKDESTIDYVYCSNPKCASKGGE